MFDSLFTIVAFIVALSVLIAVHEWGHFLVARWCGVKVLRFSIGFGKPLWQRKFGQDKTEFVIATIPLGGYVRMVDEREGEVAEEDLQRAFTRQSLGKRSAIIAAGPVFNFIFAILAYWMMFIIGVDGLKPVLAEVEPDTVAYDAGLRGGEEVVAVNGKETPTRQAVMEAILPLALLQQPVNLTLFEAGLSVEKQLDTSPVSAMQKPEEMRDTLGLHFYSPPTPAVLERVQEGEAGHTAGLRDGDIVLFIDQQPIDEWNQLVDIVQASPGKSLSMVVLRDGQEMHFNVRPLAVEVGGEEVGRIGSGVRVDEEKWKELYAQLKRAPLPALNAAFAKTWEMSFFSLRMVGEMVMLRASLENISGPLGIAQYAKRSAQLGLSQFLGFLAIISLSLGVLNLLPIPVLDGGHLLFNLVELVKGSAVSEQTEMIAQRVGLALIMALTVLAIYNDLVRQAG